MKQIQKIKTLYLLNELNLGGLETLALDVCNNIKKADFDLVLVSLGGGDLSEKFVHSGVEFYDLKKKGGNKLSSVMKLRKIIKNEAVDIVHSHESEVSILAICSVFGLKRIKLIRTIHGFLPRNSVKGIKDLLRYLKQMIVIRINFIFYDKIITVSEALKNLVNEKIKIFPDKTITVYNGIDFKRFEVKSLALNYETVSETGLIAGMVGSFDKKDQMTVCRSLPHFFEVFPGARFTFVGGSSDMYSYKYEKCVDYCKEKGIIGRVDFLGKRKDASCILRKLDLFVYSTLYDTFGLSVIESMYAGVPTIATKIPVMMEISGGSKNCLFFRPEDHLDLSAKMIDYFSNPQKFIGMIAGAKKWVENNYSIDIHMKNLEKIYKSTANG